MALDGKAWRATSPQKTLNQDNVNHGAQRPGIQASFSGWFDFFNNRLKSYVRITLKLPADGGDDHVTSK